MSEFNLCGNHLCVFGPRDGMGTNAGCSCFQHLDKDTMKRHKVISQVAKLVAELSRLREELAKAKADISDLQFTVQKERETRHRAEGEWVKCKQQLDKAGEDLKIQEFKLRNCIECEYFLPLKTECAFTPHPCELETLK